MAGKLLIIVNRSVYSTKFTQQTLQAMKSVILLSGPVGAGKTTVAPQLVALLAGPVVYIEGDKFWGFIAKGAEHMERFENFKITMRAMTVTTIPYARSGYQVVLDFSIPPRYLATVHKILSARDIPLDYVVLRPSEQVCAERAATRDEGRIADYTQYKKLYNHLMMRNHTLFIITRLMPMI